MAGPILYTAEVDYPAEAHVPHGKWNDWYAHRHAPDLFKLGARSVASYRPVVGGLNALNVYEIPDSSLFKTEAYLKMTPSDPYAADTRGLSEGKKRAQTLYLERALAPADGKVINADWISMARFAVPEVQDTALADWVKGDLYKKLSAHGVKHIRYGTQTGDKVGAGTFRPRCIVFAEWAAQPPEAADLVAAVTQRFGAAVTEAENFVGWRAYPWPDVKRS